jgi:hypothetical protein
MGSSALRHEKQQQLRNTARAAGHAHPFEVRFFTVATSPYYTNVAKSPASLDGQRAVDGVFVADYTAGLVIALFNSLNLFWIVCTCA